jgi:hypothetical protein
VFCFQLTQPWSTTESSVETVSDTTAAPVVPFAGAAKFPSPAEPRHTFTT